MSEVTDVVLPILQKIQQDIALIRKDMRGLQIQGKHHDVKLERLDKVMTAHMGITLGHKFDIDELKSLQEQYEGRIRDLEER